MPSSPLPSTPCSPTPTSASSAPDPHPSPRTARERHCETLDRHPARECLDHTLITGQRHLAAVLREYLDHYNTHPSAPIATSARAP
jgi:hypothetical protein